MNGDQRAAEIARIIGTRVAQGSFNEADRQRLNQLVATEAGMSVEEADRRVRAYEADAQRVARETEERARQAADTAARAASISAWWFFGTMLLGALAAFFGAGASTSAARAAPMRSRTVQFFCFEIGAVSSIRTCSPAR